jgi:uncharacterized protein (DUF983 family)
VRVIDALKLLCPVCGRGKIFGGYLDTPAKCPSCGFYFMRETGYWLPHAPISYLLFIAAAVAAWAVLRYVLLVQSDVVVLTLMLAFALLVTFWGNRYTKMAWLLLDLYLHPARAEDFESRGRG